MAVRHIPLTKGKFATIDADDFELVSRYKWRAFYSRGNWYAQTDLSRRGPGGRKTMFMHRLLLGVSSAVKVDHRDHDGLNNRRGNLRVATESQNQMNRQQGFGLSKHKGVTFNRHTQMWLARIACNQQTVCLGSYVTEQMAALAYDLAAEKLFKEYAKLNLPRKRRLDVVQNECWAKLERLGLVKYKEGEEPIV